MGRGVSQAAVAPPNSAVREPALHDYPSVVPQPPASPTTAKVREPTPHADAPRLAPGSWRPAPRQDFGVPRFEWDWWCHAASSARPRLRAWPRVSASSSERGLTSHRRSGDGTDRCSHSASCGPVSSAHSPAASSALAPTPARGVLASRRRLSRSVDSAMPGWTQDRWFILWWGVHLDLHGRVGPPTCDD